MEKYWKRINTGWKRIHYILSIVSGIFLGGLLSDGVSAGAEVFLLMIVVCIYLVIYFLIVIIIEWIKEGFMNNH